ncbi:cytochrome P450 76M5-like [Ananas comosus]|uniref:Cytochrome P450 76M5-like n=1 Tax=Ananas comosus TaxID=4615 RepID=A0A6P5EPV5_ANACO|nr:cytochrome P450 76M5-like [Ananas comosus]
MPNLHGKMEFTISFLWISLTLSFLYLVKRKLNPGAGKNGALPLPLPPGPTPLPIIGNILDVGAQPHRSLARLARIYGPVMSVRLGLTTTVVVSSPAAAREVLQKKDQALSARWVPDTARALGHHETSTIWLPSGDPLRKHLRAVIATNIFSPRSLDTTRAVRERQARELVANLRRRAGQPVRIGVPVFNAVLNIISNLFFSEDVVDLASAEEESNQEFKRLISSAVEEIGRPNISDFFPFLRPLDLQGRRRVTAGYIRRFYNFFGDIFDRRLAEMNSGAEKKGDFLDSLLELHSQSKLQRREIITLFTDFFAAGSDTSSNTVEWAMAELLRNPAVLAKARAELRETLGPKQEFEESDIARLPFLQAVTKETMRLHPAGPLMLPHKPSETEREVGFVEVAGLAVPSEARVMVNAWAIGRDPEAWEEAEEFRPERFLGGREVDFRGKDFEFLPFGYGRRACPGVPLAVRVVPLVLGSILHAFDWRLPRGMRPDDVDLSDRFAAALTLAVPLTAVPVLPVPLGEENNLVD